MALASKKSSAIHSKTGGDKTKLLKHFQSGSLDDISTNPDDDRHLASIIYQIGEIQEDIDELRRYVTNEATGSAVKSIRFVNASDLPTSGKGLASGTLYNASGVIRIA
tara:strand:+ start:235 stop:558 length:324 start_codon:yes stop_codon:yes gene_type:complete